MSSAAFASITALQYFDVSQPLLPTVPETVQAEAGGEPVPGVPEAEVQARIAAACAVERAEVEGRLRSEGAAREMSLQEGVGEAVRRFADERSTYFARVETEVVQLALAIARKILQREAQLDSMLLAGLVRIALDGMQSGPAVRLLVPPDRVEAWQRHGAQIGLRRELEIVADAGVGADECVLETEMGSAHLSCETQLKELEQGFLDLLGQRPDRVR